MDVSRGSNWTCYICHKVPSNNSIVALQAQEDSKKTYIFVDSDYRSVILIITTKSGIKYQVTCSKHIGDIIKSSTTDPAVKQTLIDSLIKSPCAELWTPADTATPQNNKVLTPDPVTPQNDKLLTPVFHVWKDNEEDRLVFLRHEMHDDFIRTRNHTKLWAKITEELKSTGCDVTPAHAFNKYAALKKKWKEIIDSPSGSEKKYFRHRTSFDNLYGHKASTKPVSIIDTDANEATECEASSSSSSDPKSKKLQKSGNKRKSSEFLDCIQVQHEEDMQKMHQEKMQRMDRMLDLYERELLLRESNK